MLIVINKENIFSYLKIFRQSNSLIDFYQKLGFHKTKLVFWDNKKREIEYWMIKKL